MGYSSDKIKTHSNATIVNDKPVQNNVRALQDNRPPSILQMKANNTSLPDNLKSGIENLSGRLRIKINENKNSKSVLPL